MTTLSDQDFELAKKHCRYLPEADGIIFNNETLADFLAERDSIRDSVSQKQLDNLQSSIDLLTRRQAEHVAELEKDAARYHWLKDNYHGFAHYRSGVIPCVDLGQDIDRQIAFMKRAGK